MYVYTPCILVHTAKSLLWVVTMSLIFSSHASITCLTLHPGCTLTLTHLPHPPPRMHPTPPPSTCNMAHNLHGKTLSTLLQSPMHGSTPMPVWPLVHVPSAWGHNGGGRRGPRCPPLPRPGRWLVHPPNKVKGPRYWVFMCVCVCVCPCACVLVHVSLCVNPWLWVLGCGSLVVCPLCMLVTQQTSRFLGTWYMLSSPCPPSTQSCCPQSYKLQSTLVNALPIPDFDCLLETVLKAGVKHEILRSNAVIVNNTVMDLQLALFDVDHSSPGSPTTATAAPPHHKDDTAEEVCYETERWLPLRGWSPVGQRYSWGPGLRRTSATFPAFVLPSGWEWDGSWRVWQGHACCDEEGWWYATESAGLGYEEGRGG